MRELKRDLPVGTVTFLFTDIEGSTPLVAKIGPKAFRDVLERHNQLIRDAVAAHHGVDAGTAGDSFLLVFQNAESAVSAAIDAQRALAAATWPEGAAVRVRMGLHTGQGIAGGDGYVGLDIHRAARIAAAAHGGQVLLSEASRAAAARDLPPGVGAKDLGQHDLRGLAEPERIYQLMIDGLPSDFPPLRSNTTPRTPLPVQLTTFIGRERELAEVTAMLQADRLVTLVGVGGIGKTRLMIQAALPVVGLHRHGACFVELAPITDPGLVQPEIARALGVQQEPGRPISDALIDFLRAKDMLLLLDNCEHVIDAASELAHRLLEACPTLRILASSREPLGIGGETIFTVPSLELPDALDPRTAVDESGIAQIGGVEAVRLFVERARAVLPAFGLDASNVSAVVQICRRLDGIPLALELASARVAVMSVTEIADRLGDRFRLLTGGGRAAVPRQQTLQAAIDWSWDLLTAADRRFLRCLSVFVGGWTLEAAAVVTESRDAMDALDGLGRLVARSLVFLDRAGPTRYGMLETIRQYADAKLVASGEAETVHERHLAYYQALAATAEPALQGPDMVAWLQRLDPEAENLRAALGWAFQAQAEAAVDMSLAMRSYWRLRSVGSEGLERLDQAVDLARSLSPAQGSPRALERSIVLAKTLATAAQAHALWADAIVARGWADEAVALARLTGDQGALSRALSAAFLVAVFSSQLDGGDRAADALRDMAAREGDWWSLVYVYWVAAEIARHADPALARARVEEATEAARRSGNPATIAFAALARGTITSYVAGLAEGRPWFDEAISGYRAIGDRRFEVVAKSDLAHALRHEDALDEAEALYAETIKEWLHLGNRGALANQLESFAYLAIARGHGFRAARLLGAAEALREVAGSPMQAMGTEHEDYDTAVAQLREGPDRESVDAAWADGRRLTADAAVAAALEEPAAGQRESWTGPGHVVDRSADP
jgi:predicted ATPase/class 3 adenylate cyclase